MKRRFLLAAAAALSAGLAVPAVAQAPSPEDAAALAARGVAVHIRPAYRGLADATAALTVPAEACDAPALRAAYDDAFDAWMGVQHIAFGPIEQDGRRFAVAFWPDTKGFAAKALNRLTRAEDPAALAPEAYAKVSVAARGLLALERMLFDQDGPIEALEGYRCDLTAAIARDLAATAATVAAEWNAPPQGAPAEQLGALYASFDSGLESLTALRLGRPLGSAKRSWPRRAEAWRSGRSMRNIRLSLAALAALHRDVFAQALTETERDQFEATLARTLEIAGRAPDDLPAALEDPQARFGIEALQSRISGLQRLGRQIVAPRLGATIRFNSMDGD